jgi:protein-tyrosine-phosphatase
MSDERPSVLFVCVQNAGRSQMAAALLRRAGGDRIEVRSAVSEPADAVHPVVLGAMREIGIDLTRERPKLLEDDAVRASDVVITMGCGDACPVYPGKRYVEWDLEDPAGQPIEVVRRVRDEIAGRVEALAGELGVPEAAARSQGE